MSILKLLGAAAVLWAAIAAPALAQQVIYEPGYCAFYYPNANCQNMGPGNPNDVNYRRAIMPNDAMPATGAIATRRPRIHRSASASARTQ
jgi:hypothetical protein